MKKIILSLSVALFLSINTFAQNNTKNVDINTWQHASFEDTGVYGVNTQKAIDFLKEKKRKPSELIVGVLDSGVELTHEDLKDNAYVNKKEVAGNKKDDDKNGYVDDVNGWNFIGGANGNVDGDTLELTREYLELKKLFEGAAAEENIKKDPTKFEEYKKVKAEFETKLAEAKTKYNEYSSYLEAVKEPVNKLTADLGDTKLTAESLKNYSAKDPSNAQLLQLFAMVPEDYWTNKTMKEFGGEMLEELQGVVDYYGDQVKYHLNVTDDFRAIVGDNYADKKEKIYGNNDIDGPDSSHGTHVSGIIAAKRNNGIGIDGIAGDGYVKIMSVRTVPNGDERDKDVANAIRYAVDNGAKILNMSFGKAYSPEKELVWDAFKYADAKGVLLIKAAGNENANIDEDIHFPTNFDEKGNVVAKNVITVGSNTVDPEILRSDFSNFGKKSVDVFAPGSQIYSSIPTKDGKYKAMSGTSMASPVVAGVAALVWGHYPKLKAEDVKKIILESVNKNPQLTDYSVTGGVVDAYKAVQLAEQMYKDKKLK